MTIRYPIKLIIANDNPSVLESTSLLFAEIDEIEVVSITTSGKKAISDCFTFKANIILIDPTLPDMDGITVMNVIHQIAPKTKFVFLASSKDSDRAQEAFDAGASNFVVQGYSGSELVDAVKTAVYPNGNHQLR